MKNKILKEYIENYKPKYIYQRYNEEIRKYEVINDNFLVEMKTGMSFDFKAHLMLGKLSENLIDLIEVRRLCKWRKNWANRKWFFMVWLAS